jgi:NADP-dependent aldehyde dehydrogenase
MTVVTTIDPRDGQRNDTSLHETTSQELDTVVAATSEAANWLNGLGRDGRARLLDAIAASLESRRGGRGPPRARKGAGCPPR